MFRRRRKRKRKVDLKWRNRSTNIHCKISFQLKNKTKTNMYSTRGFCGNRRNPLPDGSGQETIWLERADDIRASLHAFLIDVCWREPANLRPGTQQRPLNATAQRAFTFSIKEGIFCQINQTYTEIYVFKILASSISYWNILHNGVHEQRESIFTALELYHHPYNFQLCTSILPSTFTLLHIQLHIDICIIVT